MIQRLERVLPEAPGRPDPLAFAELMQKTTREIAFSPDAWTNERAQQMTTLFDRLASSWRDRADEARDAALEDALTRGGVGSAGLALEVGSGTGVFTSRVAQHFERVVAIDLSLEMLRLASRRAAPRICADAARLPLANGSVSAVVLANCFLFPAEVNRVLASDGALLWISTLGERTPIYLSAESVEEALPGSWSALTSEAGWGSWVVLRRGS